MKKNTKFVLDEENKSNNGNSSAKLGKRNPADKEKVNNSQEVKTPSKQVKKEKSSSENVIPTHKNTTTESSGAKNTQGAPQNSENKNNA